MARFEKGKGKRRTFWDTALLGKVLAVREWSEFDRRLTGYLRGFITSGRMAGKGIENGLDHLAGGYRRGEKMGAWLRRTRPGVAFPDWLPGDSVPVLMEAHDKQKIEFAQKH